MAYPMCRPQWGGYDCALCVLGALPCALRHMTAALAGLYHIATGLEDEILWSRYLWLFFDGDANTRVWVGINFVESTIIIVDRTCWLLIVDSKVAQ